MSDTGYFLSKLDGEIERLGSQYQLFAPVTHQLWDKANLGDGAQVLDAGCGPGFGTVELSARVGPTGKVTAFDRTEEYLAYLRQQLSERKITNVEVVEGLLSAEIPLADAQFDFIFTKFVHIFIPDLLPVIREYYRLLKPTGKLLICEPIGLWQVSPPKAIVQEFLDRGIQHFKKNAVDIEVGRWLPNKLITAGFQIVETIPEMRIGYPDSQEWQWMTAFYERAIPVLVAEGALTDNDVKRYRQQLTSLAQEKGSFMTTHQFIHLISSKN